MVQKNRHGARALAAAAMVAALALAGCSKNDDAASPAASDQPTTVRVVSHESFNLPDELIARFEKESGYTIVKSAPGDTGQVVNQLVLADGKPGADMVFGVDTYTAYQALDGNTIADYSSPKLPAGVTALEGKLNPIDQGEVCVNYDREWFTQKNMTPPLSFADLSRPEYAALLAVENPALSSPGLAFLAATAHVAGGTEGLSQLWGQLLGAGTRISGSWTDAYYTDFSGSEGKGNYPLVVSYSSSPAAENGRTGVIESTCVRQVEYAGVLRGAENPEGAEAFIDFLLSEDVQKAIPESMYVYPVADVELPASWQQHAPRVKDPIVLDAKEVGAQRAEWIRAWRDTAGM